MSEPSWVTSPEWNERAIYFDDFDMATGEAVIEAARAGKHTEAMYLTLVASARYIDDARPVFASLDELRTQPFRLRNRVMRYATMAAKQNGLGPDEEEEGGPLPAADADVPASAGAGAAPNGRGA